MLRAALTLLITVISPSFAGAAQSPAVQAPQVQKSTQAAPEQQPGRPSARNVRLDLSITDQRGDRGATPKVVTLTLGEGDSGKIRTVRENVLLNMDAAVQTRREGHLWVSLTLEYRAPDSDGKELLALSESFAVYVEDGKPLVVSQSADPTSDRKIKVEIKAAVLK
jgi:hypothetical protein